MTRSGAVTARPVASVMVAAKTRRGATSPAARPLRKIRRSIFIRSAFAPCVRPFAARRASAISPSCRIGDLEQLLAEILAREQTHQRARCILEADRHVLLLHQPAFPLPAAEG